MKIGSASSAKGYLWRSPAKDYAKGLRALRPYVKRRQEMTPWIAKGIQHSEQQPCFGYHPTEVNLSPEHRHRA
jgi:hypothetical protein